MPFQTDDLRIRDMTEVRSPRSLQEQYPVSERASVTVFETRREIQRILHGEDDRLLVVVGPCSVHDTQAAMEYAERLLPVRQALSRDLLVVMRVYFEKPRTTVGWKGLINDPNLDGSFEINKGLCLARKLLLDLAELGVPAGTEFLDLISPQYIADLVSWGAIGARTTESQGHRELASEVVKKSIFGPTWRQRCASRGAENREAVGKPSSGNGRANRQDSRRNRLHLLLSMPYAVTAVPLDAPSP